MIMPMMGNKKINKLHNNLWETGRSDLMTSTKGRQSQYGEVNECVVQST